MTEYSQQILSVISSLETQLESLKNEQNTLAEKIENTKDSSVSKEELEQIKATMNKVSAYNTKLLSLKATMTMLTGRSKQLLNKADKLKEIKTQYLLQIDDIRRKEQEKDQTIAAKTISSPSLTIPTSPEIPETPGTPGTPGSPAKTASTPGTPEVASAPSTPTMTKAIPKVVSVKKKKKSKAREVTLGDESSPAWVPKKSLSQKDLLKKQ
ncbi:hypothetical protein K501DRAFT_238552 [Backusella circina FSU 941]|nr:hypothetical protein K501DRAFT_238552 [Backusella circina FSU 941]